MMCAIGAKPKWLFQKKPPQKRPVKAFKKFLSNYLFYQNNQKNVRFFKKIKKYNMFTINL